MCIYEVKGVPSSKLFMPMYLLIIFLPLLSFLVSACFGRYIGRNGSVFITTSCIFLTAIISTVAFYEVGLAEVNCYVQIIT